MPLEQAYFIVERIGKKPDFTTVEQHLKTMSGVASVRTQPQHGLVAVEYDSACASYDEIEHSLNRFGYQIAADASNIHIR